MEHHETEVEKHHEKKREELEEKAKAFEEELIQEGVGPQQAATIAGEEIQVKEDMGELGPEPGTRLTLGDQYRGKEFAPHEEAIKAHTEEAPGTCPQCGVAVGGTDTECPACGWHLHHVAAPGPEQAVDPAQAEKDLEKLRDTGVLTPAEFEEALDALKKRLAE